MKVKYVRKSLWEETLNNFKDKKVKMESDLKKMHIKKRIPLTAVIHLASTRPISFDGMNWQSELKKLARKRQ